MRIGFYYRKKVIINFQIYLDLPIARYLCHEKGPEKHLHKTFSLLPSPLVPYHKHDLTLMTKTLSLIHQENLTLTKTIETISAMGQNEIIDLQPHQLHEFQDIFTQAMAKLSSLPQINPLLPANKCNPVSAVLDFISTYQSPAIHSNLASPTEKLSLDFFFSYQPINYFSRQFLFGTPSQKRHPGG